MKSLINKFIAGTVALASLGIFGNADCANAQEIRFYCEKSDKPMSYCFNDDGSLKTDATIYAYREGNKNLSILLDKPHENELTWWYTIKYPYKNEKKSIHEKFFFNTETSEIKYNLSHLTYHFNYSNSSTSMDVKRYFDYEVFTKQEIIEEFGEKFFMRIENMWKMQKNRSQFLDFMKRELEKWESDGEKYLENLEKRKPLEAVDYKLPVLMDDF